MPYRRRGKEIQVKKAGKWQMVKRHKSVFAAKRHLAALKINVHK